MTSSGPYTMAYDFKQMYDMTDLRGALPVNQLCSNSIAGMIKNHPDMQKFAYIMSIAQLNDIYNDPQANFTLFVPSDKSIKQIPEPVFTNMDQSTARHLVKTSTLNRRITSDLLQQSPASIFYTLDHPNNLFITNISGKTYINNDVSIIHTDMQASNGIIHIVDSLLWPQMSIGSS